MSHQYAGGWNGTPLSSGCCCITPATMPYRAGLRCHRKQNTSRPRLEPSKISADCMGHRWAYADFCYIRCNHPALVLNISVLDISDKVIRVSPHQCWIELSTGGDIKRPQENARRCRIPDELPASNRSSHRRQATPIGYDSLELVSKRGKIVYELVGFVLGQTPKRHTTVAPAAMTVKGQTEGLSRHFGVQVFQADWVRTQLPNGAKQQRIWESEVITVGSGCVAVLSFSLYRILNYQKLYLVHLAYFGSNDFG